MVWRWNLELEGKVTDNTEGPFLSTDGTENVRPFFGHNQFELLLKLRLPHNFDFTTQDNAILTPHV